MNGIVVSLIFWGVIVSLVAPVIYLVWPAALPGTRGQAARRVAALEEWRNESNVKPLASRAKGYFEARDYLGVESAYLAARRIIDGESEGK